MPVNGMTRTGVAASEGWGSFFHAMFTLKQPLGRLLFALCAGGGLSAAEPAWQPLFNDKDLTGWTTWLAKPHASVTLPGEPRDEKGAYTRPLAERDPLQVFTVAMVDGRPAIRISGQVFGELRTVGSFTDYHLKLQFKWGEKKWPPRDKPATPRDSGLLYHVHAAPGAEGKTWARSIELQIQDHDVGDLYAVNSQISVRSTARPPAPGAAANAQPVYDYDPKGDWHVFSQVPGSSGRCVKQPDNEKPTGEWNTVELICLGEESIHIVNGKVVMRLRGPRRIDGPAPVPVTAGPLIFQSEGAELYYRDIEIRPITAIPAEFAEQ
jgi:hypothetical protein